MDLYRVIDKNTKKIVEFNFNNKQHAKKVRDTLNLETHTQNFIISRSADHWKGLSQQINQKKRKKNKY